MPRKSAAWSGVDEKSGTARAQLKAAVCRKGGLALARPAGDEKREKNERREVII